MGAENLKAIISQILLLDSIIFKFWVATPFNRARPLHEANEAVARGRLVYKQVSTTKFEISL